MPKFNWPNQTGAAESKQIVIIAIVTIIAALMIIAVFAILSRGPAPATTTNDFLQNLERQRQSRPGNTATPVAPESAVSYRGVLSEIKPDALVITETDTQNKITVYFAANTPITYNGQTFSRSKFYVGDQLQITAKNLGDKLQAESITVLVSASPATAAPTPGAVNVQPDGSIKPL